MCPSKLVLAKTFVNIVQYILCRTQLKINLGYLKKKIKSLSLSQVVMAVAQLYWHLAPRHELNIITKSLVRLLRSHRYKHVCTHAHTHMAVHTFVLLYVSSHFLSLFLSERFNIQCCKISPPCPFRKRQNIADFIYILLNINNVLFNTFTCLIFSIRPSCFNNGVLV